MKKKKTRRATRAFYAGLSYLSPRWNTKLLYLRKFGRLPDLKHPQTLNEKLLKQKLERFGTDPVVRQCADKYRVRDYVDGCGCGGKFAPAGKQVAREKHHHTALAPVRR